MVIIVTNTTIGMPLQFQFQWIGLRDNLQETIDFPIKYGAVL